jgi:HD superfamily phosphohydrolase
MIRIRDPLHGTVQLTDIEEKLLDSQPMQRLRGIRQLAMAHLVYPGANHTRFEHSIGTLALSEKICREIGVGQEGQEKVRLAALLHDVGHVCFSHEAEAVLAPLLGDHEKIGRGLVEKSEIADIIGEQFSPREIARLCTTPLGEIITSDIGSDRMDYLLRDSHYTGVAYGVIDSDRIASSLAFAKQGLVLQERGLEAAESLLVARFTMFSTVYLHKTVRIASRMLQQAISLALQSRELDAHEARDMNDAQMLQRLSDGKASRAYAMRLLGRRLYKRAYSLPLSSLRIGQGKAEETLSDRCGCTVLVDVPCLSLGASVKVLSSGGKQAPISSCSQLVASLQKMQKSRLEALVICEKKDVKKVAAAAKRLLGS